MKARLIEIVGYQLTAIAMWDGEGCGSHGSHRAEVVLRKDTERDADCFGEDYQRRRKEVLSYRCGRCGQEADAGQIEQEANGSISGSYGPRYNTASGRPEPGDLFWQEQRGFEDEPGKCFHHDNCDGRHLNAVLPTGEYWDIDSRANNCTRPDDRLHRCWVREGEPPNVTVGKKGDTCSAGAGSIATPKWHGFLRNGEFVEC